MADIILTGGRVVQHGVFMSPDVAYLGTSPEQLSRYAWAANPITDADPSGYFLKKLGGWIKDNWKAITVVVVMVAVTVATAGMSSPITASALVGAAGGLTGSVLNQDSFGQTLWNTISGAAFGAFSQGLYSSVGALAASQRTIYASLAVEAIGDSVVRGIMRRMPGGKYSAWMHSGAGRRLTDAIRARSRLSHYSTRVYSAGAAATPAARLTGEAIPSALVQGVALEAYHDEVHDDFLERQVEKRVESSLNKLVARAIGLRKRMLPLLDLEAIGGRDLPAWYMRPAGTFIGRHGGFSVFRFASGWTYGITNTPYDGITLLNPNTLQPVAGPSSNFSPFQNNPCPYRTCMGGGR